VTTPLEAARQIAGREPLDSYGEVRFCMHCQATRVSPYDFQPVTDHLDWCPWLMLPQIVAALEAAEALVGNHIPWSERMSYGVSTADPDWKALAAALQGVVP